MKSKATKSVKKSAPANASAKKVVSSKPIPPLLEVVCRALDDKKAGEVRVLGVSEQSSITDFLVIATGTSEPHLRALRVELEKAIDATGTRIVGTDTGMPGSGWLVIDAFDVMVHVLTQENRDRYSLENLWKDADEVSVDKILGRAKPAAPVSVVAKAKKPATAPKKTPAKKKSAKTGKPAASAAAAKKSKAKRA